MNRLLAVGCALLAVCGAAAARPEKEFVCAAGRSVFPSQRTWDFDVAEAGVYAIDISAPDDKTRPGVCATLDGVQIAFASAGGDFARKADASHRLRRVRWLEKGTHRFDLYLNLGPYPWADEMELAMDARGVRATLTRLENGETGFWMEGVDPDCMARVMGETLVVAGCCAGDFNAETQRRREFTMEVSDGWSQTLAIGESPVRFEYPCPEEGVFEYVIKNAQGETVEGPWAFAVTDIGRKEQTDLLTSNDVRSCVSSREPVLVDRVDCAAEGAGGTHLFREGGRSEVVDTPDGAYRIVGGRGCVYGVMRVFDAKAGAWRSAKEGEKGAKSRMAHDWFAYSLKVAHPGRSHALVVRVPNDARHLTHVVAYDRRTQLSAAWGVDSGEAPAAGPWSEMKIPLWPNSGAVDVMVLNTDGVRNSHVPHPDRRGAVASLALVEYPDGFPALEAPACGWNATRDFGWNGEQINLGPNERAMPPLPDAAAAQLWDFAKGDRAYGRGPYHDWRDFSATWDRTFELEAWRGGTLFSFPAYTYGMATFQGAARMIAPPASDVYAQGCFGGEGERNPFDRDVFALMLQKAQKHGVRLVCDFMIQRTYPGVVAAWARYCGMDASATNGYYLSARADGAPFRLRPVYAGLPNPAHPLARRIQVEFCRELGRRYGRYRSFGGIVHRFSKSWPPSFEPWFHSGDLGLDDFTVGEFSKATGIALAPVGNDEAAFDARKKRLLGEYAREWSAWRAQVCLSLQEEMLAALREGAPDARFFVNQLRDADAGGGLDPAVFGGRRDLGFDPAQTLLRGPGVEINNLDPVRFGNFWVKEALEGEGLLTAGDAAGGLPPPRGLCCNSSFRCSPYHLEPAALALAENRLDTLWAGGQWCLPPLDDALRGFVRAYRAIPDGKEWTRLAPGGDGGESAPVAVWRAEDGGDAVFWAVNRTDAKRRVLLRFEKEPASLVDCVDGTEVARGAAEGGAREIVLPPFMPGVFRAKGAAALVGASVPVEPEEETGMRAEFAFLAAMGSRKGCAEAVETAKGAGDAYYAPAGALGRRDCRWTFDDLFAPMREALDAGEFHALRRRLADFRTAHRWWFEAFGWPDGFCPARTVGRLPLVKFLRQKKRTEMWFGETNGVFAADFSGAFPKVKDELVCAAKDVALDIFRHGPPGGTRRLELTALFGGGYGDIRVEDGNGGLLGTIENTVTAGGPRFETRVLSVPIPNPGRRTHFRLIGTGERGIAVHRLGIVQDPPAPITEWQVVGPFDKGGGERDAASYEKAFPPETEPFDAEAEFDGIGGGRIGWKTVKLGEGERVVDLAAATPCDLTRMNSVTYLRAVVAAPRRTATVIGYVNDYYGSIWLNGRLVVPEMRGPAQSYGTVEVTLEKGDNVILVKTSPGSAGVWHFGAAINLPAP